MLLATPLILPFFLLEVVKGQTAGEQNVDDLIKQVFRETGVSTASYSDVTEKAPTGNKVPGTGTCKCVPYYLCANGTIVEDSRGVIDIAFASTNCDDYLDVCCKFPSDRVIPPEVASHLGITPVPPTLPPDQPSFCGIRNSNGIGFKLKESINNEAEYGEFPFMLTILTKNTEPDGLSAICGASLIAPNVILTGAHCIKNIKTDDIKVRAGEWDTQTERERYAYQERDVSQIIKHEEYKSNNLFNDVALMILNRPFDKAAHIGTICLPREGELFNSKNCFATGWGKDVFGKKGRYHVILKKIELPIVPRNQCEDNLRKTRLGAKFVLHESFICAGGNDTCTVTGDSGGPLVCPDPSNPRRYLQAGIVAWGIGCGDNNVPGVYVDVSQFRSWIDGHMSRLNLDTAPYNI